MWRLRLCGGVFFVLNKKECHCERSETERSNLVLIGFRPFALMQKDQKIKAVRLYAKNHCGKLNCANSRRGSCALGG